LIVLVAQIFQMRDTLEMKPLLLLIFLVSCSQIPAKKKGEELVSVNAALNHAQASYLKGCVDAYRALNIPAAFARCRDNAHLHRQELDSFMGLDL
jgi:hypothetical protein